MSIAAIILAAGFSRRLGRPKQTVELCGETLLARAVRIAIEGGLSPVIAVLADRALVENVEQQGAVAVMNLLAAEGIASSIRAGVEQAAAMQVRGAVLMTCDQPGVCPDHLVHLAERDDVITGSGYAGRTGIPAYFPEASFAALLQLQGDTGARELLRQARVIEAEGLGLDVDTEADVLKARELFCT